MMHHIKNPLISIIIPTFKSPYTLRQCLSSIYKSDFPTKNFEVIVVDHGFEEKTKKVANDFPVKYLSQRDPSLAKARNNGILASSGSIIVFVDDDVRVPLQWLNKIKVTFERDNNLCCLGGPDLYSKEDPYFGKCINIQENFFKQHLFVLKEANLRLKGCNMAFRKEVFSEIGLFDTKRIYYHREDANFISRMKRRGMKIKYDKTLFLHHHTPTLRRYINKHIISHKGSQETFGTTYYVHYLAFIALAIGLVTMLVFPKIIFLLIFSVVFCLFLLGIIVCIILNEDLKYSPGISVILLINLFFTYTKAIYTVWIKFFRNGGG